jgi:hypothetical protein
MPYVATRGNALLDRAERVVGACDSMPMFEFLGLGRAKRKPRVVAESAKITADEAENIRSLVLGRMQNAIPGYFRLP